MITAHKREMTQTIWSNLKKFCINYSLFCNDQLIYPIYLTKTVKLTELWLLVFAGDK